MNTVAVVIQQPTELTLQSVELVPPSDTDIVVDVDWSGISTGTERLLWSGCMPHFPGMGYPLVPGYESIGHVVEARPGSGHRVGERVFVPGSRNFKNVRGLFGGAASRLVVAGQRAVTITDDVGEDAILIALAATAQHVLAGGSPPQLIVGHGVLGRLLARLCIAHGGKPPVVWESRPDRTAGACGYDVIDDHQDKRNDYAVICDASGDAALLDTLIGRLARGGELVLAGFYSEHLSFAFPPAFLRETRIRIAAEWNGSDLAAVLDLLATRRLSLNGLISHRADAGSADDAYRTAFEDPSCLKMVLDWRTCS
jgi:bacteriochlorophyllide a dehydrogenase